MSEHPTTMELEQLSVDDLPLLRADEVRRHLLACERCAAVGPQLVEHAKAYFAARPAGRFMEQLGAKRRRPWRWRWAIASLVPTTAVVALMMFGPKTPPTTRYKGGGIDILRKQAGSYVQMGIDDAISAGDELGFILVRPRAGNVRAWAVDAAGKIDALTDGAQAMSVGEQRLRDSAIIEAPCRDLHIVVIDDPALFSASADQLRDFARTPAAGVLVRSLRCR